MNKRLFFLLFFYSFILSAVSAQQTVSEQHRIYSDAESDYIVGRLEEARATLTENLSGFQGDLLQDAYRLLVLCSLGLDDDDEAERLTYRLLAENPYYSTTSDDPQRFIDMVNRIKSGRGSTITTASSQAENLEESPVPVTLITEDMIRISGARNLKEVLIAYVPSMTSVDCNDDINFAMRGIFSQGQEKILILLNGHRLNSYATNVVSPDFSISLDKIKQIEVLRGPASSLYGGVALSAVINVITKQGIDVDGIRLSGGGGSYGQWRGDILFGKRFFDLDIVVWGSLYKADGQRFFVPCSESGLKKTEGDVRIGKVGDNPSYDLGITLSWRGLYFLYNTHFSQIHSPYTMGYTYSPYNANAYATFRGLLPSYGTQSHHTELSYRKQWDRLFLSGTINYDLSDMTHYQVISDSAVAGIGSMMGLPGTFGSLFDGEKKLYRYHDGLEKNLAAQIKGDYTYIENDDHTGLFGFGANFGIFRLVDSRYVVGSGNGHTLIDYSSFPVWAEAIGLGDEFDLNDIAKGRETNADAYVQIKHRWGPLIFNGGLRYDYKRRYDDDVMHEFSPRLALIFVQPKWHVTFSYSKSFVDAPYYYRKINMLFYEINVLNNIVAESQGEPTTPVVYNDLKSERLYSWQLTLGTTGLVPGLDLELNSFFNYATDLIYPQRLQHGNLGKGKNFGLEFTAAYHNGPFDGHLSASWLHVVDAEYFGYDVNNIPGIPDYSANAVLAWRFGHNLRLHTHLSYMGSYKGYVVDLLNNSYKFADYPSVFVTDLGVEYKWNSFDFSVNVHNLFNHHYTLSGIGSGPIQQQGRWFMGTVGYKF
jgi:iron complex outermembrane receptor protein